LIPLTSSSILAHHHAVFLQFAPPSDPVAPQHLGPLDVTGARNVFQAQTAAIRKNHRQLDKTIRATCGYFWRISTRNIGPPYRPKSA